MRKLIIRGGSECNLEEAPIPVPGPGELRIRTVMSALCGSELSSYRGDGVEDGNAGHEGIGIVEVVGTGVDSSWVGKRVGVSAIAGCGAPECEACANGQSTYCPNYRFYGGMHAEYFITAPQACMIVPHDVPDEVAVLITGDGMGVPYHTSVKISSHDVSTVAIFGAGPVGLGNIIVQTFLGREIIAIDLTPERLEIAKSLGAAHTIDGAKHDPVEAIKELTGGGGCDVAIDAAGVPATVAQCFRSVRVAGTVVFNGEQQAVTLSPSEDFIRRDITAVGSWFYHVGEFPAMLDLYRNGLPVADLVTDVFPFEEAPEGFSRFSAGKTGKVLLKHA